MVEVFKTNIATQKQAVKILKILHNNLALSSASFDLEDCDKILRVVFTQQFFPDKVIQILTESG